MVKELTKQEFISLMIQLGYNDHIFFMKDEDDQNKLDSPYEWLDYAINTWIEQSIDLLKGALDYQDDTKLHDIIQANLNVKTMLIPLLKFKMGWEALWTKI